MTSRPEAPQHDAPHAHEITVQPRIKLRVYRRGTIWVACAQLVTPEGPIALMATADESTMLRIVKRRFAKMYPRLAQQLAAGETGGFLSGLRNLSRKIARARVLAGVMRQVEKIQANPIIARAVGLTTAVVPGLRAPAVAIKAATSLVNKALAGDVGAREAIQSLKDAAINGSAEAKAALGVVSKVSKAIGERRPVDLLRGIPADAKNAIQQFAAQAAPLAQAADAMRRGVAQLPAAMPGMPGLALAASAGYAPRAWPGAGLSGAPWAPVHEAALHALRMS